jgi:hypothetical protein
MQTMIIITKVVNKNPTHAKVYSINKTLCDKVWQ